MMMAETRTLIYDEQCRLCTGAKETLERAGCEIRFVPYGSADARRELGARYRPGRPDVAWLIEQDGRVREGADAFLGLLPSSGAGRVLRALAGVPCLRRLVHRTYHVIARHRYRWFGSVSTAATSGPDRTRRA